MKRFIFKTFLFCVFFLLSACSGLGFEYVDYKIKTQQGVYHCEYSNGVYFNCNKFDKEIENETVKKK